MRDEGKDVCPFKIFDMCNFRLTLENATKESKSDWDLSDHLERVHLVNPNHQLIHAWKSMINPQTQDPSERCLWRTCPICFTVYGIPIGLRCNVSEWQGHIQLHTKQETSFHIHEVFDIVALRK